MFDPYNIYKRQIRSSHSGQVLRKKLRRKSGKVYTNEELISAIPPLRALGYHVEKGKFYSTQITSWSDTYILDTGSVVFSDTSATPFLFSTIWSDIKSDFQDCLSIDPLSVINLLFEIDLLSINLYGSYQTSGTVTFPSIGLYIADPSKAISSGVWSSLTISNPSNNFNVSFSSYSDSSVYLTESSTRSDTLFWGYAGFVTKNEIQDSNYLNVIQRGQPAIITALRNDDYSVFNPPLFYMFMSQAAQTPATISNSFITFQVKMIVEHK